MCLISKEIASNDSQIDKKLAKQKKRSLDQLCLSPSSFENIGKKEKPFLSPIFVYVIFSVCAGFYWILRN